MAVDIVLYNAVALSVRKLCRKLNSLFHADKPGRKANEHALKNTEIIRTVQDTYRWRRKAPQKKTPIQEILEVSEPVSDWSGHLSLLFLFC